MFFFAFVLAVSLAGCSAPGVRDPRYAPARDLSEILSDFQRLSHEDLYRFPIPKDVTGINIMKATLVRLEDYEKKNPGKFPDIVAFAKATAYERLRAYDEALRLYRRVARSDSRLSSQAAKNIEALESLEKILKKPLSADDPVEYVKQLDEKVEALQELSRQYRDTAYEYLARLEEEKIDRAKVSFVELNRYRIKDGNQWVILGYSQLVTKHRQSKNLHRYLLDFGDFYARLAKEYAMQNDPEGLSFEFETFEQFGKSALQLYAEVAQADGVPEKIEAKGKIEAMRGLIEKMRRLNL